ncbi:MAG: GNAT family N-acetyltransferase [Oligoflexia bacterium]|nr:GNAT family N-acetyltransferase [Oligoflexia bacterium]
MEIVSRCEIGPDKWNEFVNESMDAWLWHHYDIMDALSTWRYTADASIGIIDKQGSSSLLAILPMTNKLNYTFHSPGGVAFSNKLGQKLKREIWKVLVRYLEGLFLKHSVCSFNIHLPPLTPNFWSDKGYPLVNPLLFYGFKNDLTQTMIINLNQSSEQIFNTYTKGTKYELNRIEKSDISLVDANGIPNALEKYYELHVSTYRRNGQRPHPYKYFECIFNNVLRKGLCRIIFLEKNGRFFAVNNTALYKKTAFYWTGASINEKELGENRILLHNQIMHAKSKGFSTYEVGEVFPDVKNGKLRGLSVFKKSFGGEMYPYYKGSYVIPQNVTRRSKKIILAIFNSGKKFIYS